MYEFTFHEVGQPFVITDSSGNVVVPRPGEHHRSLHDRLRRRVGQTSGSRSADRTRSFDVDLCKAVEPLTGGDSARYLTPRPIGSTDSPMGFYEYLPPSYSATGAESPLLVFFNGYGENGDGTADGLSNLLFAGIPRFINVGGWATDRPFVVLSPQHVEEPPGFDFSSCDGVEPWGGSCNMQVQHDLDNASPAFCTTPDEVHDFIDYAVAHYNVDPTRVYVTGLSCGAFGIWEYLAKYDDELQVAAAVPIAGDGRPGSAAAYCGARLDAALGVPRRARRCRQPAGSIEPMTALADCPGSRLTRRS